jgi:hypothetical protein
MPRLRNRDRVAFLMHSKCLKWLGSSPAAALGNLRGSQFLVANEGERAVQRMPGCEHYFVDCRSISVDMFSKTMDLDLRWHLMRKTGEVTRIMDRGTSAIQNVLSTGDTSRP